MKKFNFLKLAIPIFLILIPLLFICCHPVTSGIEMQRNLMKIYGLEKKSISSETGKLVYFEGGNGQTLIFIHGFMTEAGNWYRIVPELINKYHLIIPDMPGHGESDPQGDRLTPEDLLSGVLKIINMHSRENKVVLVGSSLGGWVSLMAALERQEKISVLILENSAGLKTDLPERLLRPKDVQSARELYAVLLGDEAPNAPDFLYENLITYLDQPRFEYLFNSIKNEYFLDHKLSKLKIPVYLIWGGADKLFTTDYAERMKREIPGSELYTNETTGHAMHFTKPQVFSNMLIKILDRYKP